MNIYEFVYHLNGDTGFCTGVSVDQARDRAKVRWLKSKGVPPGDPRFRREKLTIPEPRLELAPLYMARFRELYRCAKEDQLNPTEKTEFIKLQSIIRNL